MSECELEKAYQSHKAALEQLAAQVHHNAIDFLSGSLSKEMDHSLVFEGLTAFTNPLGEFQVDIGEFRWETMKKEDRLESLRSELEKVVYQVKSFKEEMDDIISFAGDIDQDEIDSLQTKVAVEVRGKLNGDTKLHTIPHCQDLQQLAIRHKFQFDMTLIPDSFRETEKGLTKTFDAFSVSMVAPSEEEIAVKIELEFNTQLLRLYKSRFATLKSEQEVVRLSLQPSILGKSFVLLSPDKVERGYLSVEKNIQIIERLRIEYCDGCVFEGRFVNGMLFGKGSMRLSDGSLFKGEIVDESCAKGEIIEGKRVLKSSFRIVKSPSGHIFCPNGKTERFLDGKIVQAGFTYEDGSFFGWVKIQDFEMTGQWDSSGKNFTGKKMSLIYSAEGSFYDSLLEGKGKVVSKNWKYEGNFLHGKYHGPGKLTEGSIQTVGEWQYGEFIAGSLRCGSESYFGQFKDGRYHGQGRLRIDEQFYEGEFSNGKYHGHGTLKQPNVTIRGIFVEGKAHGKCTYNESNLIYEGMVQNGQFCGFGKMTTPNFRYEGEFLNNEKHGKGKQVQKDLTYTGDFAHGKFEGHGVLVKSNITFEGPFRNGMLNGYATVKPDVGSPRSSFFQDGKEQLINFDIPIPTMEDKHIQFETNLARSVLQEQKQRDQELSKQRREFAKRKADLDKEWELDSLKSQAEIDQLNRQREANLQAERQKYAMEEQQRRQEEEKRWFRW